MTGPTLETIEDFATASGRLADPFADRTAALSELGLTEDAWGERARAFRDKLAAAHVEPQLVVRYREAFERARNAGARPPSKPKAARTPRTPPAQPIAPSEPAPPVHVPSYMLQSAPAAKPQPSYLATPAPVPLPPAPAPRPPAPSPPPAIVMPAEPVGNETAMLPRNEEVLRLIAEAQPAEALARAAAAMPASPRAPPPAATPKPVDDPFSETKALPTREEVLRLIAEADPRAALNRAAGAPPTPDPVGTGTAMADMRDALRAVQALPFREGEPVPTPLPRPVPEREPTGTEGITPEQIAAALEAARRARPAPAVVVTANEPPLKWPVEAYARFCVDVNMRPRDDVLREYGISHADRVALDAYWQRRTADPAVRERWLRACEHYRRGRYGA